MTANTSIDPAEFLQDQLAAASPDLLRDMLTTFIEVLMGAEGRRGLRRPVRRVGPESARQEGETHALAPTKSARPTGPPRGRLDHVLHRHIHPWESLWESGPGHCSQPE
jgi:hypothetical protein